MRAVLFGDTHLESGGHLGQPDPIYGNTRLADAERILGQIAAEECDVLVFLGDLARNNKPGPTAYRIAQEALAGANAKAVAMIVGNHDHTGEKASCVHVVAEGLPRARVFDSPQLTRVGDLQLGVLPWTPPSRMFTQAPHNPRQLHQLVADALLDTARGLGAQLDPDLPSLLVGHWALMTGAGEGAGVVKDTEVVIDVDELAATGWDVVAMGHYHKFEVLSSTTPVWGVDVLTPPVVLHVGPPMRGGFGEAEITTGYAAVEWHHGAAHGDALDGWNLALVQQITTDDRRLVTLDLEGVDWPPLEDLADAIVRVRVSCSETEADQLRADGHRALNALVERVQAAGAARIVGPTLQVERAERERRSDLTVDTTPSVALERWLAEQGINGTVAQRVLTEAGRITA